MTLLALAAAALFLALKNLIFLWLVGRDFHKAAVAIGSSPESRDRILMRFAKNPILVIIDGPAKTHSCHSDDLMAEAAYIFHRHFSRAQRNITFIRVIVFSPHQGRVPDHDDVHQHGAGRRHLGGHSGHHHGPDPSHPCLIVYYILSLKLRSFHLVSIEYGCRFLDERPVCQNTRAGQSTDRRSGCDQGPVISPKA